MSTNTIIWALIVWAYTIVPEIRIFEFIKPFLDWKWNRFRIRELVKVYFGRYVIKIGQKYTPMHFWDSHDLSWPHSDHLYHHCSSNFWIIVFHTLFSWRKFIFQSMPPSTRYPLKLMYRIGNSSESKDPCMKENFEAPARFEIFFHQARPRLSKLGVDTSIGCA